MKKIIAALFAMTLIFSSAGSFLSFDDVSQVEAKSYKSGKKNYNNNNNSQNDNETNSNAAVNNNNNTTNNNNATTNNNNSSSAQKAKPEEKKGGFMSSGLMKGLMIGGLAGLLLGGLFGDLGMLGSILGFMINMLAIVAVVGLLVFVIKKLFGGRKKEQKEATDNPWNK